MVRIAIVYDCLYPHTVGGAERWLRALAESLGREHEVTYLTRRQWPAGREPRLPGVRCLPVSPGGPLYTQAGRRRLLPPLAFGAGVLGHFLRHRRDYDVVHCLSYPFFSLLALRLALARRRGTRLVVEWVECLTRGYWHEYGGRFAGAAGYLLQGLCVRLTREALVYSAHTERRLLESGFRGEVHRLSGFWAAGDGPVSTPTRRASPAGERLVLFAGRHIPDKRVVVLPDALAAARRRDPAIRAILVGDGPDRGRVLERIDELGLEEAVEAPGFLERERLEQLLARASCLVSPSLRDGYGMVVVEAAAAGVPVVVCAGPDNAATELVEEGVNGTVAPSSSPEDVAAGILRVLEGGEELRGRTAEWFGREANRLAMESSIKRVRELYEGGSAKRAAAAPAARDGVSP